MDKVNDGVAMWWDGDEHAITPRQKVQSCAADVESFRIPLYTSAVRIPDGFALVPIEPTRDMLWAGGEAPSNPVARLSGCQTGAVWRAMLGAASLHPAHTVEFASAALAKARGAQ